MKLNNSNSEARYRFFILITITYYKIHICMNVTKKYVAVSVNEHNVQFQTNFLHIFSEIFYSQRYKNFKNIHAGIGKIHIVTTVGYHFFRMSGSANVSYSVERDFFLSSNMLILSSSISCKMSAALFNSSATTRSF